MSEQASRQSKLLAASLRQILQGLAGTEALIFVSQVWLMLTVRSGWSFILIFRLSGVKMSSLPVARLGMMKNMTHIRVIMIRTAIMFSILFFIIYFVVSVSWY